MFSDAGEIEAAHAALEADHDRRAALALRLALLTGCRIGEVLNLQCQADRLKRAVWVKPAASTKQKRLHIVPLPKAALAIALELTALGPPIYDDCRRIGNA